MKRILTLSLALLLLASCLVCSADDELASAQKRATALSFVINMGLSLEQVARMVGPLQRIQRILLNAEEEREAVFSEPATAQALQDARDLLLTDQEVPEETLAIIYQIPGELDEAQRAKYMGVDAQMQNIAALLSPAQNANLDWTAPASVRSAPTAQQRAALQREIEARVNDAVEMLNQVKFLDNFNFVTGRITIIDEYLRANQSPENPLPENAMDISVYYTDQARLVPLQQWEQAAPDMAAEMVSFTKAQILMQAGTSMLAQANMAPQQVLSLFG